MHVEIPILKRCCFCLPLRRGLLLWAYVMLIVCTIKVMNLSHLLFIIFSYPFDDSFKEEMMDIIIFISIELIILIPDVPFTIMFIVAAHRKNNKYFRIYYYYMIISASVYFLCRVANIIWILYTLKIQMVSPLNSHYLIQSIFISVVSLGVQIYMILLIRSEMIKLVENCEFRFTNEAAEAECRMVPQVASIEVVGDHGDVKQEETMSVY